MIRLRPTNVRMLSTDVRRMSRPACPPPMSPTAILNSSAAALPNAVHPTMALGGLTPAPLPRSEILRAIAESEMARTFGAGKTHRQTTAEAEAEAGAPAPDPNHTTLHSSQVIFSL
jgi:hypothetical protein